ncbi:hypothetical protein KSS87_012676 [Heliosperma pusillum]|nr:hypothetical protein KSS87_012676 [Heliosperma pusillum]
MHQKHYHTSIHKMKQIQQCFVPFLLVLFIIQSLTLTVTIGTNNVENRGNETDHIALLAIKDQLVDHPMGYLNSWNHSLHHCYWDGVTCGRKHRRVIALNLTARVSGGTLSPFIGNLSFLIKVWLPLNNLHGEIPPQIGRLRRLRLLKLSNNTLTGEISTNISGCINLRGIDVGFNKLYGRLPSSIRACSKLKLLSLHFNNFTGVLFDSIANLSSLETISTSGNAFTGNIPSSIGKMRNLTTLFIGENQLSGVVPTSIYNLSSLQILELVGNKFRGTLPEDIGVRLPRLVRLNLSGNKFHGSIPKSITNLTTLEIISFEENDFIGKVPNDFSQFKNLQSLDLYNNHLEGDINFVASLVNCSNLQVLDLTGNKFTGKLPASVANLSTTVIWLALGHNSITGEIPVGIKNLVNLQVMYMGPNKFTGTIPDDFGSLQTLEQIDFGSNMLTGKIPTSVGSLSRLSVFYLNDNKLQGSIPPNLGNCQSLLYFDVSGNELNGTLPREIFGGSAKFLEINVSENNLEGFLPLEISKQVNIVVLDLSKNKLSGEIPGDIGDCSALQHLNMNGNNFHGSIPSSFASLASLQILDLSKNNLSGTIPDYFSKFPLVYLNLSYNNFEGRVPTTGVFTNVSGVSLVGNSNLCGGIPVLNLPRCVEQKKRNKSRRISRAFSLTIPIISAVVVVVIIATLLYITCCLRKRKAISVGPETSETFMKVSYNMLLKATDGFASSNLLGAGAYGSVFKGVLDGKTVAIKVLDLKYRGALKSFMAECKALRNIRHRNLVGMITTCSSIDFQGNDFKALVYEFMPNGSLDRLLHNARNLSLLQRLEIAIDVGHALCYLHNDCEIPIIHCDLKPSNVLLDNDMVAKVGDFGISKFLVGLQHLDQSSTTGIKGTVGYAPPEYGLGSEPSTSGDIYSYGILLLELMTGKTPTDEMFKENCNLHKYAEAALPDRVLHIVDPILVESELTEEIDDIMTVQNTVQQRLECISSIVVIGVACSNHLPQHRMRISEVITKLQVAKESLLKAGYRRG